MDNNDRVLKYVQDRLKLGQEKYGQSIPLAGEGGRDNFRESLEEVFDMVVYLAATLVELNDKRFYENELQLIKESENKVVRISDVNKEIAKEWRNKDD